MLGKLGVFISLRQRLFNTEKQTLWPFACRTCFPYSLIQPQDKGFQLLIVHIVQPQNYIVPSCLYCLMFSQQQFFIGDLWIFLIMKESVCAVVGGLKLIANICSDANFKLKYWMYLLACFCLTDTDSQVWGLFCFFYLASQWRGLFWLVWESGNRGLKFWRGYWFLIVSYKNIFAWCNLFK